MKLTKTEKINLAERIKAEGIHTETTGNAVIKNDFYKYRNHLACIATKNGKLFDVTVYGC